MAPLLDLNDYCFNGWVPNAGDPGGWSPHCVPFPKVALHYYNAQARDANYTPCASEYPIEMTIPMRAAQTSGHGAMDKKEAVHKCTASLIFSCDQKYSGQLKIVTEVDVEA
jgi:hypothetical protein